MPRRKITLEEAFAVFEQHGLQVEVKAVQQDQPEVPLSSFLEPVEVSAPVPQTVSKKLIKITLFAQHTVGSGGQTVRNSKGDSDVVNNGVETYGPGICTVPIYLAQHLLYQDALARAADDRMLEKTMRNYIIVPKVTSQGVVNCGILAAVDSSFDMSSVLGRLGEGNIYKV